MVNKKIQLQDDGINLFPLATLNGIDTSNVIASGFTLPYTASQDCVVYLRGSTYARPIIINIDGVNVITEQHADDYSIYTHLLFLKKGQTITGQVYEGKIVYDIKR